MKLGREHGELSSIDEQPHKYLYIPGGVPEPISVDQLAQNLGSRSANLKNLKEAIDQITSPYTAAVNAKADELYESGNYRKTGVIKKGFSSQWVYGDTLLRLDFTVQKGSNRAVPQALMLTLAKDYKNETGEYVHLGNINLNFTNRLLGSVQLKWKEYQYKGNGFEGKSKDEKTLLESKITDIDPELASTLKDSGFASRTTSFDSDVVVIYEYFARAGSMVFNLDNLPELYFDIKRVGVLGGKFTYNASTNCFRRVLTNTDVAKLGKNGLEPLDNISADKYLSHLKSLLSLVPTRS